VALRKEAKGLSKGLAHLFSLSMKLANSCADLSDVITNGLDAFVLWK